MHIVFTPFKHPNLPISINIPVALLQIVYMLYLHDSYICSIYLQIRVNELPLC